MDSILVPALLVCSTLIGEEDVLIEILKRLPIKTLCRFVCVCKSWKSLISSPLFINLHSSFNCSATPPNLKPYIRVRDKSYVVMCVVDANHHELKHKLHFPFRSTRNKMGGCASRGFSLVGVIHGVVCVSYSSKSRFDSTILWNPAIRKYVSLPQLPSPVGLDLEMADRFNRYMYSNYVHSYNIGVDPLLACYGMDFSPSDYKLEDFNVIGFGYDKSKNEFKVVRIWMPYEQFVAPKYEVVAVSAGGGGIRRRVAASVPHILKSCNLYQFSKTGCFVNGNIHWIVYLPNWQRSVLMFDCESECFKIVDLPQQIFYSVCGPQPYFNKKRDAPQKTKLIEYGGMLAVVVDWCLDRDDLTMIVDLRSVKIIQFHTELWVMEEHGVAATWTKLYRFKNNPVSTDSAFLELDVCRDSFVDLAPYSPVLWNNLTRVPRKRVFTGLYNRSIFTNRYDEIGSGRVYEESMFLMDHPESHSYSNQDEEKVVCKEIKAMVDVPITDGPSWLFRLVNNINFRNMQRQGTRTATTTPLCT